MTRSERLLEFLDKYSGTPEAQFLSRTQDFIGSTSVEVGPDYKGDNVWFSTDDGIQIYLSSEFIDDLTAELMIILQNRISEYVDEVLRLGDTPYLWKTKDVDYPITLDAEDVYR